MVKKLLLLSLIILITLSLPITSYAESTYRQPQQESKELQLQDMLMLFLHPHLEKLVANYYSNLLTSSPLVYPYEVDVTKVERVNGFRGFVFLITLEVSPVVGPHIGVGKDRVTLQVSSNTVKLVKFEHLQTYELPPNWKHIKRRP